MSHRKPPPVLATGQRWALRDDRYEGWRYLTITELDDDRVRATTNTRRGRTSIRRDRFGRGGRWSFCGHDGPGVLPPFTRNRSVTLGCVPFGVKPAVLPLASYLDPGFGSVTVLLDGEKLWEAHTTRKRLAHVECWARATPGDWRLRIEGAMSEQLYQRQDAGWVLVAIGMGFA